MTCSQGRKACSMALSAIVAMIAAGCSTGGFSGSGQTLGQSFRAEQQREARDQRKVDRAAKLPHPVSVAHEGSLVPFEALESNLSGKTLYLQTPFMQNGQLQKVEVAPIYFAPSGQAYSSNWAGRPWQARGSSLCITANQQPNCMTALNDSTGQAFLLGSNNLLVQVGKITDGDRDDMKGAYQRAQEQQRKGEEAMMQVLGPLLITAMTSGGGGASSNSNDDIDRLRAHQGGGGAGYGSSPSYTAPIGGESGLYGRCHAVGC